MAHAQHVFQGTSLSKALIELDKSTKHYDISFVYDELEDFTVTKTVKRGVALPEAVREVCGFYPVKVTLKGHNILVECIPKDRTTVRSLSASCDWHIDSKGKLMSLTYSDYKKEDDGKSEGESHLGLLHLPPFR